MRTILEAYPSHRNIGRMSIREFNGEETDPPCPAVHVITGWLACQTDPVHSREVIEVKALLDTGCDVTLVRKELVDELGRRRGSDVQPQRTIELFGGSRLAYDLIYILPGDHYCISDYGFTEFASEEFPDLDGTDILLGQDVLNQFIVTFDGPNGMVTIALPDDPESPGQ